MIILMLLSLLFNYSMHCSESKNDRQDTFTHIFNSNFWNKPQNGYYGEDETVSGYGSKLETTIVVRRVLPQLLADLKVSTFLDLPCGDFNWMKTVNLDQVKYIGIDIVQALIAKNQAAYGSQTKTFIHADAVKDPLPYADLILCRDCLVHLSLADIKMALKNMKKSGIVYLLTTTYPKAFNKNYDIKTGNWRPLNLQTPPFNFPKPLMLIDEESHWGDDKRYAKALGLWRLDDLNFE